MKRFALGLVLPLLLMGCSDPYGNAAKLAQDVAVSVHESAITVDSLRLNGSINDQEERNIIGYLQSLNTLDGQYIGCVQAAHLQSTAGGFTRCIQSLLTGMGDPTTLAALHVSNPDSRAKIVAIVTAIEALVNATQTALGGK